MALLFQIGFPAEAARNDAERLLLALAGGRYNAAIGGRVQRATQDHLRRLDNTRANRLGGRRTHFYSKAAQQTFFRVEADGVTISINKQGFRQRVEGGVIRPVNKKYLTIPADAAGYGMRASEFPDLKFAMMPNRWGKLQPALIRAEQTAIRIGKRRKDGARKITVLGQRGGEVIFWLARKVTQAPDSSVLPGEELVHQEALIAVRDYLTRLGSRPQNR